MTSTWMLLHASKRSVLILFSCNFSRLLCLKSISFVHLIIPTSFALLKYEKVSCKIHKKKKKAMSNTLYSSTQWFIVPLVAPTSCCCCQLELNCKRANLIFFSLSQHALVPHARWYTHRWWWSWQKWEFC
jgi:hypothetical protein